MSGAMYIRYVAGGRPTSFAWATAALEAKTTQIAPTAPAAPASAAKTSPVVFSGGHSCWPDRNTPSGNSTPSTKYATPTHRIAISRLPTVPPRTEPP